MTNSSSGVDSWFPPLISLVPHQWMQWQWVISPNRPRLQPRPSREAVTDPHLCSTFAQASPSLPLGLGPGGRLGWKTGGWAVEAGPASGCYRQEVTLIDWVTAASEGRRPARKTVAGPLTQTPSISHSLTPSLTHSHRTNGLHLCTSVCVCACVVSNYFHLNENRRDMKQRKQKFEPKGSQIFSILTVCYVCRCPEMSLQRKLLHVWTHYRVVPELRDSFAYVFYKK